jgi:hypothetical protein
METAAEAVEEKEGLCMLFPKQLQCRGHLSTGAVRHGAWSREKRFHPAPSPPQDPGAAANGGFQRAAVAKRFSAVATSTIGVALLRQGLTWAHPGAACRLRPVHPRWPPPGPQQGSRHPFIPGAFALGRRFGGRGLGQGCQRRQRGTQGIGFEGGNTLWAVTMGSPNSGLLGMGWSKCVGRPWERRCRHARPAGGCRRPAGRRRRRWSSRSGWA